MFHSFLWLLIQVNSFRAARKENFFKRAAYAVAYRLINSMSHVPLPLDAGDFALLSRRAVNAINALPERARYLRGLRAWIGFKQKALAVERSARATGTTQYSVAKLLKLTFDGLFSFSSLPIRFATFVGCLSIGVSMLFAVYSIYAKLFLASTPRGFTVLLFFILFFSGVQLLFLGVLGEYIARIFDEVKARPLFVIDERVN